MITVKEKTLVVKGVKETENATYQIEYIIITEAKNPVIRQVTAEVEDFTSQMVEDVNNPGTYIPSDVKTIVGTLRYQDGMMINGNFPYSEKYSTYVEDFMSIIKDATEGNTIDETQPMVEEPASIL